MAFSNMMDEASAALALQFQLQDSQAALAEVGEASDAGLALALYRDELQRASTTIGDRRITKSIARACEADGPLVTRSFAQEQAAARDRTVALRLGGVRQPRLIEAAYPPAAADLDDEEIERLSAFNTLASPGVRLIECPENGGSSTAPTVYRRCIACQENKPDHDLATVPCNHDYCGTCLRDLFRASFTDEPLFPPRCCSEHITPLIHCVHVLLSEELVKDYNKKKVEFETKDRTYCANHACAVFIPVQNSQGESVTCPECHTATCTLCKAVGHVGDCPEDPAHKQLLELARANQWQQCPSCKRMIELDLGCNHITCRCTDQFCYVCGVKWKQCQCPQWHEARLLARARQVVIRLDQAPAFAGNQVAAVAAGLRERHDCDAHDWRYVSTAGQCEQCHQDMPEFIYRCLVCHIEVCRRCSLNRQ